MKRSADLDEFLMHWCCTYNFKDFQDADGVVSPTALVRSTRQASYKPLTEKQQNGLKALRKMPQERRLEYVKGFMKSTIVIQIGAA